MSGAASRRRAKKTMASESDNNIYEFFRGEFELRNTPDLLWEIIFMSV